MRILNTIKNIIITLSVTLLYAIWCTDALHEMSALRMWVVLVLFGAFVFHLLVWCDREARRIHRERKKKKERSEDNELV